MARDPSKRRFTAEEAIALLDSDDEGEIAEIEEPFFPGSDDDLGFSEVEDEGSDSEDPRYHA